MVGLFARAVFMMTQTIPTAEPFLLPGNRTGCLLIHGFTGAPKEMHPMGDYLNGQDGYTCLGIRLAGHATRPADMIRSYWTDWTASVEDGYHILNGFCDRIYLIGLSMGGVLSLLMSTRLSVNGVVAMSTPFKMANDWRLNFTDWLGKIQPYLPKADEPNSGWFDHKAMADHVSYPENPVGSIGELNKLIIEMRAALPEVHVPVLLIHSNDDTYVPPQNMENIFANLVNADDKAKFYITGSGHVMTRDAARLQVFETASRFIQRVESQFR